MKLKNCPKRNTYLKKTFYDSFQALVDFFLFSTLQKGKMPQKLGLYLL